VRINVSKPQDLPDLRAWLVEQWRPGGPFEMAARMAKNNLSLEPNNTYAWLEPAFDGRELQDAPLYWVSSELAQLIGHCAKSLPPTTLTRDLLPTPTGFAVYETPLEGSDTNPDHEEPIAVNAVLWGDAHLQWLSGRDHLGIASYSYVDELYYPLGRTDWAFGDDTEQPVDKALEGDDLRLASMAEDRRWLATLFLLIGQDRVAESREIHPPRQTVRRLARQGLDSNVRLVDVRRKHTTSDGEGSREVEWSKRWLVNAHWRQQAYGPNHSLRRPTLILPYIKGPEDKPLVVSPEVRVVR
jgi:hypothetical protein